MADLQTSLKTATQIPLDEKVHVNLLSDLTNLGVGNNKAFTFYENMIAMCVETHKEYIWREVDNTVKYYNPQTLTVDGVSYDPQGNPISPPGAGFDFTQGYFKYPQGSIVNGIDYSNRTFTFYENQIFTDSLIDRIKDGFYIKTVQSLSVSPTTFEKGLSTNLTFTWNVDRKDDTLVSVTLDGSDVLSQATGVNRTYNVDNQTDTRSVVLQTNVTENDLDGGSNTITNTRTSTAIIPQYVGKVTFGNSPSLVYADLQSHTKFLSTSSARSYTSTFSNEVPFFLSIKSNATILDANGFDVTAGFTKSTVTMNLASGTQSMTLYLYNSSLNSTGTFSIN